MNIEQTTPVQKMIDQLDRIATTLLMTGHAEHEQRYEDHLQELVRTAGHEGIVQWALSTATEALKFSGRTVFARAMLFKTAVLAYERQVLHERDFGEGHAGFLTLEEVSAQDWYRSLMSDYKVPARERLAEIDFLTRETLPPSFNGMYKRVCDEFYKHDQRLPANAYV